jgi:hypothetical protein
MSLPNHAPVSLSSQSLPSRVNVTIKRNPISHDQAFIQPILYPVSVPVPVPVPVHVQSAVLPYAYHQLQQPAQVTSMQLPPAQISAIPFAVTTGVQVEQQQQQQQQPMVYSSPVYDRYDNQSLSSAQSSTRTDYREVVSARMQRARSQLPPIIVEDYVNDIVYEPVSTTNFIAPAPVIYQAMAHGKTTREIENDNMNAIERMSQSQMALEQNLYSRDRSHRQ